MLPANVEKVKGMLQKSFQALPMATDLPRLANIKIVHNGSEIPAPDANATTLDKMEWIFSSLTKILEGAEAAQTVSEKFKAAFTEDVSASGTISKNQVTTFLTSIGGDDSAVIKALKPVNQVTISPAIIELKTLLGLDNMTKDVRNSWYFVIDITDTTITVSSHKRDQCIKNLFQMEWVLSFTLTRPSLDCADVTLRVDDLIFNADCHTKRPEKKEEVKRILKRYSTDEVLAIADTKIWDAAAVAPIPVGAAALAAVASASQAQTPTPNSAPSQVESKPAVPTKVYTNGDRYEGELRHGIRHGKGVYISANGDRFEGHYENGIKTGAGVYNFKNGSRLEGKFDQGSIAHGTFTFANGDKYVGDFKNDEFDGQGKWTSGDNVEVYEGSFVRGLRHGKGKLTIGSNDKYEGDFFEDLMQGQGQYTFANGDQYVGSFKAGKFEGPGEYTFAAQQKVIAGEFKNGVLVQVTSTRVRS
eukprot:TRINITY_DN3643_c0_g1_i1.p1 TRINITY_DN3643_c0_g1~~TRINITY_DN3643_c0_g1_i1.p1  ORF type:complete len:473 (+),score=83.22 TRINITY_DN3643_c0_g1_i1:54-1472(+)